MFERLLNFGRSSNSHSESYNCFVKYLKAKGYEKRDGTDADLLETIYPEERDEVERLIWKHYKHNGEFYKYLPHLKNYDGLTALTKEQRGLDTPSCIDAEACIVLFKATGDPEYLDRVMADYKGVQLNTPIVVALAHLAKKPYIYPLLIDIYIHDDDEANRIQAVEGILWRDGKFNNIDAIREFQEKAELIRSFSGDSVEEREEKIREYQKKIKGDDKI